MLQPPFDCFVVKTLVLFRFDSRNGAISDILADALHSGDLKWCRTSRGTAWWVKRDQNANKVRSKTKGKSERGVETEY